MKKAYSLIELSIVVLIIGVLVAGIAQSKKLMLMAKLNTARSLTKSSPVAGINGLTLWLETTSEKSFDDSETSDASTVSNWYDLNEQSDKTKNNVSQSDSSAKPVYTANAINGLPALKFDGASQYMSKSSVPGGDLFQTDQITVFLVQTNTGSSSVLAGHRILLQKFVF